MSFLEAAVGAARSVVRGFRGPGRGWGLLIALDVEARLDAEDSERLDASRGAVEACGDDEDAIADGDCACESVIVFPKCAESDAGGLAEL